MDDNVVCDPNTRWETEYRGEVIVLRLSPFILNIKEMGAIYSTNHLANHRTNSAGVGCSSKAGGGGISLKKLPLPAL